MKGRGHYVLIGILIGIITMQWAMPVARAQGGEDVIFAEAFVLLDSEGSITGSLSTYPEGSILTLGSSGESRRLFISAPASSSQDPVLITVADGEESVQIGVGGNNAEVQIRTGTGGIAVFDPRSSGDRVNILLGRGIGGEVLTRHGSYGVTGQLPTDGRVGGAATSSKPLSWGEVKSHRSTEQAGKGLPRTGDLDEAARRIATNYEAFLVSIMDRRPRH